MRRLYRLTVLVFLALLLVSCSSNENNKSNRKIEADIYFNPFFQSFGYIDENGIPRKYIEDKNQFQYLVQGGSYLYVDGNSESNNFSLIDIKNNKVNKIHKFNKNDGIFPGFLLEDKIFFIHYFYDENNIEDTDKRTIGYIDINNNEVKDLKNINGMISEFYIDNNTIYYTVYKPDSDDYPFDLYMLQNMEELDAKPKLIQKNLKDDFVGVYNNKIYISDNENIIGNNKTYVKEAENYIYNGKLIQFYILKDNGNFGLKVTDLDDDKVIEDIKMVNGINWDKNKIILYTNDGKISINL